MPWVGNEFRYTKRLLKAIAENYIPIYEGLPLSYGEVVTNPWALAEFRADFDTALNNIGKGKWTGRISQFKDYHYFGWLQQIIVADILGVSDHTLTVYGFRDIAGLRGYAYYRMANFLNGGHTNEKPENNAR